MATTIILTLLLRQIVPQYIPERDGWFAQTILNEADGLAPINE